MVCRCPKRFQLTFINSKNLIVEFNSYIISEELSQPTTLLKGTYKSAYPKNVIRGIIKCQSQRSKDNMLTEAIDQSQIVRPGQLSKTIIII